MSDYLLLEDGGKIEIEDESGFILLEYKVANFIRTFFNLKKPSAIFSIKKLRMSFGLKKPRTDFDVLE